MSQALPLITRQGDRIAIVTGLRTPFARQATAFHGVPAIDLGKMVVGEMLARSDIPAEVIEQQSLASGADAGSAEHRPGNCAGYRHERTYRRL